MPEILSTENNTIPKGPADLPEDPSCPCPQCGSPANGRTQDAIRFSCGSQLVMIGPQEGTLRSTATCWQRNGTCGMNEFGIATPPQKPWCCK
jgi:hypothetical protein